MSKSEAFTKAAQKSLEQQRIAALRAEIEANPELRKSLEKGILDEHFTPLVRALTSLPPDAEGRTLKAKYFEHDLYLSGPNDYKTVLAIAYLPQNEDLDLHAYSEQDRNRAGTHDITRPVFSIYTHYPVAGGEPLFAVENQNTLVTSTMAGAPHIVLSKYHQHNQNMNTDETMAHIAEALTGIVPERMEEITQAVSDAYANPLVDNAAPQQKSRLPRPGR